MNMRRIFARVWAIWTRLQLRRARNSPAFRARRTQDRRAAL